jgi:hypothetical protein
MTELSRTANRGEAWGGGVLRPPLGAQSEERQVNILNKKFKFLCLTKFNLLNHMNKSATNNFDFFRSQ